MICEFDRVRIKEKGVIGDVIDIYKAQDGTTLYLVESDKEGPSGDPDAWELRFPIFTCTAEQLEKI